MISNRNITFINSKELHIIGVGVTLIDNPEDYTRKGIERKTFELFLKSRKNDKTRDYTIAILEYLSNQFDTSMKNKMETEKPDGDYGGWTYENIGWVRSKDLIKGVPSIPNESTFYQLLKNLHESKLIEKEERKSARGKPPVYYRVPGFYSENLYKSKEDIENKLTRAYNLVNKLAMHQHAAVVLLNECHKNDPEYNALETIKKKARQIFPDYGEDLPSVQRVARKKN